MKLSTWNVNSLKVRLPHVLDWLAIHQPDVLCMQETKVEDANFPVAEIEAAGYHAAYTGQKAYNGVALLTRSPADAVGNCIPGFDDAQKRILCATFAGIRVICAYFPNGQSLASEKYLYKLNWLSALRNWIADELTRHPALALLGDFNIAPEDRDVNPEIKDCDVLVADAVREHFRDLLALGLTDSFRLFEQPEKSYSWWDYRMMAYRRNLGLRIDHILLSPPLAAKCASCVIDRAPRKLERPSDHAPVIADLDDQPH